MKFVISDKAKQTVISQKICKITKDKSKLNIIIGFNSQIKNVISYL